MQQTMAKPGSRTVTGLTLILGALALDLASELLLGSISLLAANTFLVGLMQPYTFHTSFSPGLSLSLLGAVALLGFAGIAFIERDRFGTSLPHRRLDRTPFALLLAVLAEDAVLASGLILGLVYVADRRIPLGVRLGAPVVVAFAIGSCLLWTLERIDPGSARPWAGLGSRSAACPRPAGPRHPCMTEFTTFDPMAALWDIWILALSAFVLGLLSMLAWIILFYRMFVKYRRAHAAPAAPSTA